MIIEKFNQDFEKNSSNFSVLYNNKRINLRTKKKTKKKQRKKGENNKILFNNLNNGANKTYVYP